MDDTKPISLSFVERWILANQYSILEKLSKDEVDAQWYADCRTGIERGYAILYGDYAQNIHAETLSAEECQELFDILNMHRAMEFGYRSLSTEEKADTDYDDIKFLGFDGNEESSALLFVDYFCNFDGGRYQELNRDEGFNSHMPMRNTYRRMLSVWRGYPPYQNLTKDAILKIVAARRGAY